MLTFILYAIVLALLIDLVIRRLPDNGWMFLVTGAKRPRRGTPASVGLDLFPYRTYVIDARRTAIIDTGVVIAPPSGHFTLLAARSGLHKRGLVLVNGVGIVDPDYCGRADTIKLAVRNFTDYATIVDSTQALAQAIFIPFTAPEPGIVARVPEGKSRGGFGSTDGKA